MKKDEMHINEGNLADWLAAYKVKFGHMPTKPIYVDYRGVPSFRKEMIMTYDEHGMPWVEDYDKEKHGEITKEAFHTFIPLIH